ncbi:DUF4064 domain-containing protein [Shouchella clausii]|uniref:DUF4064 domain-containing protein n=2 Tax=Shouchella TaxID=2893057 RepID=Q5WAY8_SHOC1|nr:MULTISPECIES: DUF4064 domain-containing protein [Shouchella]MCM3311277.1 DUF4064 domain-containing protein [Psychrobacillus sp. MER TA 17]ALA53080.1 hypothetical protein DB29_02252 [Shouchella clausii]MBU3231371.1 DUF4064 domain-containing protein [Shouchella clausii]MBU3263626.1 DUF4064 domain-containing protein [Shouchella clausii]MBU3508017.1 DUF4064 domain-containing protein [Shouchella clausii]
MVKRTGERVLGIIGIVCFMLGTLFLGGAMALQGQGFYEDFFMEMANEDSELWEGEENPPIVSQEDAAATSAFFEELNFGMYTLASFIAGVAGIVAVVLVGKKPVVASILFLGSTLLYAIMAPFTLAFIIPFLPMLLYIIAGIMALVRKPKQPELTGQ